MLLFDCYCSIILPTRCSLRLVAACLLFLHVVAIAMQLLHLLHDIMHLHVCINCVRLCGICMCSLIFICVCVCVLLRLHMCVSTNFVFLLFRHLFLYIAPQEGTRVKNQRKQRLSSVKSWHVFSCRTSVPWRCLCCAGSTMLCQAIATG